MDELYARVRDGRLGVLYLDVFDISQMPAMGDFEKFIPGINPVYQSPILGIASSGEFVGDWRVQRGG